MADGGFNITEAEWVQAWNQARHFEAMRGQWLGFFFTVVIGVLALAGPNVDIDKADSRVLIAVLALVLEVFSVAVYLVVARLNQVHRYSDTVITAIRDGTSESATVPLEGDLARAPGPPRRGRAGKLATTKGVSEAVLFGSVIALAAC